MLPDRFWNKVNMRPDGCWEWQGARQSGGYGSFWWQGRVQKAHRVSYEDQMGPIPEGLVLDHLCRVRHCVRPDHLEPVTQKENTLRGDTIPAHKLAKDSCPAGHPHAGDTLYVYPDGRRHCKIWRRQSDARRYKKGRR